MHRLTYRNQTILLNASIALCKWKIKELLRTEPRNFKREYFKIINL